MSGGNAAEKRIAQKLKQAELGATAKASSSTSPPPVTSDNEKNPYWKASEHWTRQGGEDLLTSSRQQRGPDEGPH